jgi:SPP1 family predicted phage head-tail adaptor
MRAGQLDQRITFQSPTVTRDSFGAEVVTWGDVRTVWANIQPFQGREYLEARATTQTLTHRIRLRYQPGLAIHPTWRVLYGARVFDIESVQNRLEENKEVILWVKENV